MSTYTGLSNLFRGTTNKVELRNKEDVFNSSLTSVQGNKFTKRRGLAVANDAAQIRAEQEKYMNSFGNIVNRFTFCDENGKPLEKPTPQIDKNGRLRFRKVVTQVDDEALREIVNNQLEENKHFQSLLDLCVNDMALRILLGNVSDEYIAQVCAPNSFNGGGVMKDYIGLIHDMADKQNCLPSIVAPMPETSVEKQYALQKLMMILKIFDPDVAVNTGTRDAIAHFRDQAYVSKATGGGSGAGAGTEEGAPVLVTVTPAK
jgi:hypothetical protein